MKRLLSATALVLFCLSIMAQNSVELTFTCRTTVGAYVQPDSILVENLSRGWQETFLYPDTVCLLNVNMQDEKPLSQPSSNPFMGTTTVNLNVAKADAVSVEVSDLDGHLVARLPEMALPQGIHPLRITLCKAGTYFLTARINGKSTSLKILNVGDGAKNAIEYDRSGLGIGYFTKYNLDNSAPNESLCTFPFRLGDKMRYVAYTSDKVSNEISKAQYESEALTLVFKPMPLPGDGIPCPDAPSVTDYDGNVYSTVQIGNQCWMKENLRSVHYADGTAIPKAYPGGYSPSYSIAYYDYYSASMPLPLAQRGYLYNWLAAVRNAFSCYDNPGVQGICPAGWHVPSEAEWSQMLEYVSSQNAYVYGNENSGIAKALASQSWWQGSNHEGAPGHDQSLNDATGFSVYPAGQFTPYGHTGSYFEKLGYNAIFWTSTGGENEYAFTCNVSYDEASVQSNHDAHKPSGASVRCLRD